MWHLLAFVVILFAVAYGFIQLRRSTEATPEDEARAVAKADERLSEIDRELPQD